MNSNSHLSFANLPLLFPTASKPGVSQLSSSLQDMTTMMLQNIYKEAQKQALFDLVFGKSEFNFPQQPLMTAPLKNYSGVGTMMNTMEEDTRLSSNLNSKKPVFTITRQDKLSKSICTEQIEEPKATSASANNANYNRKEKSLGELSRRFLTMFGRVDDCVISLDNLTKQLDVERRRVYDIINILESLGVVYRKGKNNYQWSGLQPIRATITKLELRGDTKNEDESEESPSDDDLVDQRLANKKEKSLAYLAGSFIKLFFTWKETIPLEEAAWKLSPNDTDDHKIKTKIRRLYDIANVFSSLGLIRKICLDSKKPAFKWIGNSGLDEFIRKLNASASKQTVVEEKSSKKKSVKTIIAQPEIAESTSPSSTELNSNPSQGPTGLSPKQGLIDNLMSALMDVRQKETQASHFSHPNPFSFISEQNFANAAHYGNQSFNGMRKFEEAAPIQRTMMQNMQRINFENQTTSDRRRIERVQRTPSSLNIKRPLPQHLSGFEVRSVKKIFPIGQTSRDKPIVRSLKFHAKENFNFDTKMEN